MAVRQLRTKSSFAPVVAECIPQIPRTVDDYRRMYPERVMLSNTFNELESKIDEMSRAARLAAKQLDRALEGSEFDNPPEDFELAIHAVKQSRDIAEALAELFLKLHNKTCEAGLI
jgi:hypothetical protein